MTTRVTTFMLIVLLLGAAPRSLRFSSAAQADSMQSTPANSNSKRIHIIGSVQHVGFRLWLRNTAEALGLVGWVHNMPDGSVEAEVRGPLDAVAKLIDACHRGPADATVVAVDVTDTEKPIDTKDFSIHP